MAEVGTFWKSARLLALAAWATAFMDSMSGPECLDRGVREGRQKSERQQER